MAIRLLKSLLPTADDVVNSDLRTLGRILLVHLDSLEGQGSPVYQPVGGINREYFFAMMERRNIGLGRLPDNDPEYGTRQPEVSQALREAWNWLEKEGHLMRTPGQPGVDWFSISRSGEQLLQEYAHEEQQGKTGPEYRQPGPDEWTVPAHKRVAGEAGIGEGMGAEEEDEPTTTPAPAAPGNTISEVTRRAIFDYLFLSRDWSGRFSNVEFLSRLYDLKKLPSTDTRFKTAYEDIWQHRVNNPGDWQPDWVFTDSRFDLLYGSDAKLLHFLCETVHPVVRPHVGEAHNMVAQFNLHLAADGWEIFEEKQISGKPVFAARRIRSRLVSSSAVGNSRIEEQLAERMLAAFHEAKRLKYNATRFFQMLSEKGALATAKALLAGDVSKVSDGFTAMWSLKRLDLTVEAISLDPGFASLFTEQELATARKRLENAGYTTDLLNSDNLATPKRQHDKTAGRLRVFLCHSSGDKPAVRKIYHRLKRDGFTPWLDEEDLVAGQDWQLEIKNAVRNCHAVVVFLSTGSITKEGYVQKEIKIALDMADEKPEGTIFIIPALFNEGIDVPQRLCRWHWVGLFQENGYQKLTTALRTRAGTLGINIPVNASELTEMHRPSLYLASQKIDAAKRIFAENPSKSLVDLSSTEPRDGEYLYYLGSARVTTIGIPVAPDNTKLSADECVAIEAERHSHESRLKKLSLDARTIVLTFRAKGRTFASICSLRSVNENVLARYSERENFGIVCTMQKTDGEIVFLDPMRIWHE